MRRSTRNSTNGTSLFPTPFQSCINATDTYSRELNLRPLILHLPFDPDMHETDLNGIGVRLRRNKSFVHTSFNRQPSSYPSDAEPYLQPLELRNGENRVSAVVASLCKDYEADTRPGILVMFVQPPLEATRTFQTQTDSNSASWDGLDGQNVKELQANGPSISLNETEVLAESRPLTGVIIKVGTPRPPDLSHNIESGDSLSHHTKTVSENLNKQQSHSVYLSDADNWERSIVAVFCRRSVPDDVATELLRVTIMRAITEAICYEDVIGARDIDALLKTNVLGNSVGHQVLPQGHLGVTSSRSDSSGIEREKRFVSINTCDLVLCPTIVLPLLLYDMKFMKHWDREEGPNEFIHDETHKECPCVKKFRSSFNIPSFLQSSVSIEQVSDTALKSSLERSTEFYQFFTLSAKRVKGIIEQHLSKLVPTTPSLNVYVFCCPPDNSPKSKPQIAVSSLSDKIHSRKRPFNINGVTTIDNPIEENNVGPECLPRKRRNVVSECLT